ncbi:hypothetical protein PF672P2_00020 [Parabacteroides phage PF672P2]|nr:hypothetical protein PF672P1_00059 [Parabacteroides phage PF672P1]WAX17157.1 hypothetical protein PF672P2_00020 [Parabacteroides phage PF672P2]
MAKHRANNNKIFAAGLEAWVRKWKDNAFNILSQIAEDTVAFIEGGSDIPVITSNLKDSTGVGVYMDGSLVKYVPVKRATIPRVGIYGAAADNRAYWGYEELNIALEAASNQFSKGIWICLFSTMPYAMEVDSRRLYFDDIRNDLYNNFIKRINEIK